MSRRFRIRDLLQSKTLAEVSRGRDIVAYHKANYRPGYDDWLIEYSDDGDFWHEVPVRVRKAWLARSETQ